MAYAKLESLGDYLTEDVPSAVVQALLDLTGMQNLAEKAHLFALFESEIKAIRARLHTLPNTDETAHPAPSFQAIDPYPTIFPAALLMQLDRLLAAINLRSRLKLFFGTEQSEVTTADLAKTLPDFELIERTPGVLEVKIKALVFGESQIAQLDNLATWANQAQNVHVIIFNSDQKVGQPGSEQPAFLLGANVTERTKGNWTDDQIKRHVWYQRQVMNMLRRLPQITIGVFQGGAYGLGTEILGAMDLNFASTSGKAHLPETGLGIIPGAGGSGGTLGGLDEKLSAKDHLQLATGTPLAFPGIERGLAARIFDTHNDAHSQALFLARDICRKSPTAVRAFKLCRLLCQGRSDAERERIEQAMYEACLESRDAALGREHFDEIVRGKWPEALTDWNQAVI